jgi:hypothetical protein
MKSKFFRPGKDLNHWLFWEFSSRIQLGGY